MCVRMCVHVFTMYYGVYEARAHYVHVHILHAHYTSSDSIFPASTEKSLPFFSLAQFRTCIVFVVGAHRSSSAFRFFFVILVVGLSQYLGFSALETMATVSFAL